VRWFWIFLVAFCLLVLDVGVSVRLRGLGGGPDLMLLLVLFLALYGPLEDAPLSGWLVGISKDAASAGTFGLFAVLYMGLAFFVSRIRADIFTEYNKAHIVNAFIATLVVYASGAAWQWSQGADLSAAGGTVLGIAVWNALLAPAVFWALFRLSRPLKTVRRAR
jgi:rod shape-determining protein MreD